MVRLDGLLSLNQIEQIADGARLDLDDSALKRVAANREILEKASALDTPIYGLNRGFGALFDTSIAPELQQQLQINLLRSHAAGVGPNLADEVVRVALAIRVNSLLQGYSGVRPEILRRIALLLNHGFIPCVPRTGSLGASGDLAPSAHAFLPLIGEGKLKAPGRERIITGTQALKLLEVEPLELHTKEGLALLNGTHFMTAIGALCLLRVRTILDSADVAAALTIDALHGAPAPFDQRVHKLRPLPGQIQSAANVTALLKGSQRAQDDPQWRLQDAYSLRCVPQIHGAAREGVGFLERMVEVDLNAVTDNPLVFDDPPEIISSGNFHGQSLALGFDVLRLALTDLAAVSERRLFRILSPSLNGTLPAFLSPTPGASSGYMLAQYTAAALVNELRALAYPVSTDTIPTSDNQEDHVSMGMTGGLMALDCIPRIEQILAYEVLCSCQAFDLEPSAAPGAAARAIHAEVRRHVPTLTEDRSPADDLEPVLGLIRDGLLVRVLADAR